MNGTAWSALANFPFAAGVGAALLAAHLWLSAGRVMPWPNRYLAVFLALTATQLVLQSLQLEDPARAIGPFRVAAVLIANPFVFLFFRALREPARASPATIDLLHAVPACLVPPMVRAGQADALDFLLIASMLGYGGYLATLLRAGPAQFAATGAPDKALRWLQAFTLFYAVSVVLDLAIALELLDRSGLHESRLLPVAILLVFAAVSLLLLGALGRPSILDTLREQRRKRSTPKLPAGELEALAARVREALSEPRCYGDEDLSLRRFSRRLGVPARQVSEAINGGLGMSFTDLVTRTRIDAARRLLRDPVWAERTVLDVAFAVGFRSKSNFHRAFRELTGTTPTAWRRGDRSDP